MAKKKHIIIACTRLDLPGGIERMIVNVANLLDSNGYPVTLLVLDETAASFYPLSKTVQVVQKDIRLGIGTSGNPVLRKISLVIDLFRLRKLVVALRPDMLISTEYPITCAFASISRHIKTRLFSWEHHHHAHLQKSTFWELFSRWAYAQLDGCICLTESEKTYFERITPTHVIPNFITFEEPVQTSRRHQRILTVGHLILRKGIDLLLPIAGSILRKNPEWSWTIIGSGEMQEYVAKYIQEEGLGAQLYLLPPVGSDLSAFYSQSSIFCLTSRSEAFPMVLLEAMNYGLPCVSFNCLAGPAEIIRDPEDGLLIPVGDAESFQQGIQKLIDNPEMRLQMGRAAALNIQRFNKEDIFLRWESLIEK